MFKKSLFAIVSCFLLFNCNKKPTDKIQKIEKSNQLPEWQEGFLDIHHINTGRGDASFFILPDGTTMVFDAGNLDKEKFEKNTSL